MPNPKSFVGDISAVGEVFESRHQFSNESGLDSGHLKLRESKPLPKPNACADKEPVPDPQQHK